MHFFQIVFPNNPAISLSKSFLIVYICGVNSYDTFFLLYLSINSDTLCVKNHKALN